MRVTSSAGMSPTMGLRRDDGAGHARGRAAMKVLLTLTDVEPAVRLNALLEKSGIETVLVSPLDDVPGMIRRQRPDVIVLTGGLLDATNLQLVKNQLWDGAAVIGLADVHDDLLDERLRALGFVEVYA